MQSIIHISLLWNQRESYPHDHNNATNAYAYTVTGIVFKYLTWIISFNPHITTEVDIIIVIIILIL